MTSANNRKQIKTAEDAVHGLDLTGEVFLITGAYSGLGAATAKALLSAGATVIAAGRNAKLQTSFAEELAASGSTAGRIEASHTLDLGSLASVREFADWVTTKQDRIDCLINNAGVMNTPPGATTDGFEIQMGVNVIGHFLLAKLLADVTRRQVWLSSHGHMLIKDPPGDAWDVASAPRIDIDAIKKVDESNYDSWWRYQQSKLGDILLAKQFPVEYSHLKACAVHPGVVRTKLSRHMAFSTMLKFLFHGLFAGGERLVSSETGARTQTLCAVMPESELVAGAYYVDCAQAEEAAAAKNMADAKKLYDYCEEVTRAFQV